MNKKSKALVNRGAYPLNVSLAMIVVAIVLSFVDLTFLNDVIGKVLDLGAVESMAIAFALGLVGIAIMAHQGIKEAHEHIKFRNAIMHYLLWLSLGIAFVLIRLFSASIMNLEEAVTPILGVEIREIDLVLAPLMLFLYIATGLLAKDGFKNLLMNPDFDKWRESQKEARILKKSKADKIRQEAEEKQAQLRKDAEKRKEDMAKEAEKRRVEQLKESEKQREADEKARIESALNGGYENALAQYRAKEDEIKQKYQKISNNIDYIKSLDRQEKDFETKVKPSLMTIVNGSIHSVQNNVALAIRKSTNADITELRQVIEAYNNSHNEKNH